MNQPNIYYEYYILQDFFASFIYNIEITFFFYLLQCFLFQVTDNTSIQILRASRYDSCSVQT